jgi:hypothetical protein
MASGQKIGYHFGVGAKIAENRNFPDYFAYTYYIFLQHYTKNKLFFT